MIALLGALFQWYYDTGVTADSMIRNIFESIYDPRLDNVPTDCSGRSLEPINLGMYRNEFGSAICEIPAWKCDETGTWYVEWNDRRWDLDAWKFKMQGWYHVYYRIIPEAQRDLKPSILELEELRMMTWNKLTTRVFPMHLYTYLPREFKERFRVDMWGNVVTFTVRTSFIHYTLVSNYFLIRTTMIFSIAEMP